MAADEVIEVSNPNDLLRDFFDFGDDLILPDKPFDIKKESATFIGGDFDGHFDESSHDFFLGASTPSPSSSSTASSSAVPNASSSSRFQSAISSIFTFKTNVERQAKLIQIFLSKTILIYMSEPIVCL